MVNPKLYFAPLTSLAATVCASLAFVLSAPAASSGVNPAADWPAWRGPTGDGIAAPGQEPPLRWSETENVLWKSPIPGRGHGTPTVVGDRIYLATADNQIRNHQSVLCLDRHSGKRVWQTYVHNDKADPGNHANSSAASSTLACDGRRLFISFLNAGAVWTTALAMDGKVLWQQKICDFVTHQGYAASPVLHGSLVLIAADHKGGGVVAALEQETGRLVWSEPRPQHHNYTTPAILQVGGRTQMVLAGAKVITSLDPTTGRKLWEVDGSTEECVVTAVTDGTRIFVSGGYPRNHTVAVRADGTTAWENTVRVYVPSMIQKDGHLYATTDAGMAVCWKSDTGQEIWKERLGGDFYASPVMVGDRIYATNLRAKTFVYEATPRGFKLLAENQAGDEAYASPVVCGSRIYLRVADRGDDRQEFLYCIGNPSQAIH